MKKKFENLREKLTELELIVKLAEGKCEETQFFVEVSPVFGAEIHIYNEEFFLEMFEEYEVERQITDIIGNAYDILKARRGGITYKTSRKVEK